MTLTQVLKLLPVACIPICRKVSFASGGFLSKTILCVGGCARVAGRMDKAYLALRLRLWFWSHTHFTLHAFSPLTTRCSCTSGIFYQRETKGDKR